MARESNTNDIADFDIDEVIDWDKHDIPSKDIEFEQLQSLNVAASNVASTATTQSATNTQNSAQGRDGLVLERSQLLASQQSAGLHHRDAGTAIVSIPQVPQSSAINPVFPGDPSSLLSDIRQEYLHAHNLIARSRTPPTPTFPSENFDLPPITPPGSLHTHSTFPVGQQPLRMALLSNLNRPATVQPRLPSFVQPNLPPSMNNVSMNQQLQSVVGESIGEGSNIEQLIDEIVERDMPQGVSEPIVFAPQVSQQPNPPTAHLQIASNTLQKGISPTSPGQLPIVQTSTSGKSTLPLGVVPGGSPLNAASSPGSPLSSSRSPSPKVKQTNHTCKGSTPVRSVSQAVRLTPSAVQAGSSLQNVGGLSASQSAVKAARPFSSLTNSQMLQMAVPSAVASGPSHPHIGVNSSKLPPSNVPVKNNVEGANVSPQGARVIVPSSTVQANASQVQGPNSAAHNVGVSGTNSNKVSSQKGVQGTNVATVITQSSGTHNQTNPLQALASNPQLLGQLVKAIGQPKQQGSSGQVVASAASIQTGQPLICYVVPQSGAQGSQAKSSIPLTASNHPVKMILVNANSPLKSPVSLKPHPGKMALMNPANTALNSKSVLSPSQSAGAQGELETAFNPSFKNIPSFVESGDMAISGVNNETFMSQSNVQLGSAQTSLGLLVNNLNTKKSSTALGSAQSNTVPLLQTPLSSSGNVVQITFVNEATAISQVVAASPSPTLLSLSSSSGGSGSHVMSSVTSHSSVTSSTEHPLPSSHTLLPRATTEQETSANQHDSDEDDDDSTPLSQVAENLKKVAGTDDVKKKKKKKKEKGTKRKKREKDGQELNKPLTAYELFFKETQATIRSKNPAAQFEDIKRIVDQLWENLNENHRKGLQEKAQQEFQKAQEEHRAKTLSQEDEPSPKMRKVEKTDTAVSSTASATLEDIKDSAAPPAVPGSKPFGRAQSQVPMAGKPVATVPPMAASNKAMSSTVTQPTVPTKPKKSKVTVNPISQRICLCDGCNKPARTTKERGTQYCSNECIVKHCRMAFTVWVEQRNMKSEVS
ncbi:hypothetical protein ACROYT_G013729 [Oculina patagonica]